MKSRLHQLSELGQSVWIDYLSRDLIESGTLAKAIAEDDAALGDRFRLYRSIVPLLLGSSRPVPRRHRRRRSVAPGPRAIARAFV